MNLPEDPFVRELLPEFVDTWLQDIKDQFRPMLDAKNADEMYRFGHTLKGSCYQFSLDDIATLGIELMGFAKSKEWGKAAQIEKKLIDSFTQVKKVLETEII